MANEYLKRTPTSTGNSRVWTWSGWIKRARTSLSADQMPMYAGDASTFTGIIWGGDDGDKLVVINYISGALNGSRASSDILRDPGSWYHILVSCNSTLGAAEERIRLYINGTRILKFSEQSDIGFNINTTINNIVEHNIGRRVSNGSNFLQGEMFDVFLVDGQALTPDVFGFYKVGKGYISVGSTQSTDFRPGQWVPKTPRVIKTAINNSGGFGANGFYLPMNDSNNFGADFHCEPNSIIKLQENLPQPRCRIDGVGDYTGALRDDPYAANLVLALPFVSGGLQSGFGDYSAAIKGSGSAKTLTNTNVSIGNTASHYGSSASFNGTNAQLTIPASADFDLSSTDFTIEMWANPRTLKNGNTILSLGTGGNALYWVLYVGRPDGGVCMGFGTGGWGWTTSGSGVNGAICSGTVVRTNQWNHVAVVRKSNNLTTYVNGVSIGITTDFNFGSGSAGTLYIGSYFQNYNNDGSWWDGYLQDLRIYKGVAKYKGGFDVPRPYTPVGIATWRAVPDSPANNFATMNPLIEARPSSGSNSPSNSTIVTFADGNLNLSNSASSGNAQRMVSFATIGISTGKWYYEEIPSSNSRVGLSKGFQQLNYTGGTLGSGSGLESSVTYVASGAISLANNAYYNTATTLTPPSYNNTNIIGVSIDASLGENNLTVRFYKDGVDVSTLTGVGATSPVREWFPTKTMESSGSGDQRYFNFGQNPSFSGNTTAGTYTDSNNKGLFKYQPPSGFLALCEDNLPTPAISDPGKYFKTVLYTGDGNSGRSITGVGFQPDFVWIKARDTLAGNNIQFDSVRGSMKSLFSQHTLGEYTDRGVYSFDVDGFTTGPNNGDYSYSGANYVAWCWKAGAGTTSTNTNGSITSVVSVNQDAGFSIVSWTGAGSGTSTVGHGLGKQPAFIITKARDSASDNSWIALHKSAGTSVFSHYLYLNSTAGANPLSPTWPATSTIFTTTPGFNSAVRYISYCWAEIEGFSKFGSYTGNGSADGPFIYTGGRPAFVMIKRTDSTQNWPIIDSSRDSVNVANRRLFANLTDIEDQGIPNFVDILSNGFKCRDSNVSYNASGGTYIFACWMESPFTTANAK